MVDPIISQAAQSATEQGAQQGPQSQRQVSSDEQSQFEEALNRPEQSNESQPGQGQVQDPEQVGDKSYQQALVEGIQEVRQSFEVQGNKVEEGLARAAEDNVISPMELMQAQMDLVKMEMEMQVVTKGADKVSTDVQTLMKGGN